MTNLKTTLGTLSAILGLVIAVSAVWTTWIEHGWVTRADMRRDRAALLELIRDISVPVMELKIKDLKAEGREDEAHRWQTWLDQIEKSRADKKFSMEEFR